MPIDRQYNKTVFECDSCSETFEGEPGEEFAVVWASAKREGWRAKKIGEDWVRACGKCRL